MENLVQHQKVSKYYENDRSLVSFFLNGVRSDGTRRSAIALL